MLNAYELTLNNTLFPTDEITQIFHCVLLKLARMASKRVDAFES